ncbi:MAG: mannosyltransferase [Solirubrobacteraceae bacterium]|jgi:4-amino-4-deoxy-L-arabinose transferase-like glycosyltransferase|nr:mannosyltransferase [Solirubrobacteraceae bacterium]
MPTYASPRSLPLRSDAPQRLPSRVAVARVARDRTGVLLFGVLVVAAVGFALGLGHSSLFIDEVYSWQASRGSLGGLAQAVQFNEVTPPLYYLILHTWIHVTGSDSEVMLRLPSVVAGVGLVAALYWLTSLVAGRRAGLITATLATASPLVLLYAQQVRSYIWVMLAVTIAVAAVLQATRDRSARWLVVAAVAAACSVLLHYTALLVLGPLAVWLWLEPGIDLRWRAGFAAAIAMPLGAVIPLALHQTSQGHQDLAGAYASLTMFNALRIAGSPFDGRATGGFMVARELGAVVVVEVLALLALADRFRSIQARRLIAACAATPLLVVLLAAAAGQPVALTRYTAVAVPFVLVAIGAVAVRLQRPLAALLLAITLLASGIGLAAAARPQGQNPDTRAAITTVAHNWRPGDTVASVGLLGFDGALSYYADKLLEHSARDVHAYVNLDLAGQAPAIVAAAVDGGRIWLVSDPVLTRAELRKGLEPLGLRPAYVHTYTGNAPVQLVRADPIR